MGGAVKHPEEGKIVDMSQAVQNEYGIKDAYLKIYPLSGYGNADDLFVFVNQIQQSIDRLFGVVLQVEPEVVEG